jgi:hypothetical protein
MDYPTTRNKIAAYGVLTVFSAPPPKEGLSATWRF